jgi:hypothetical protein
MMEKSAKDRKRTKLGKTGAALSAEVDRKKGSTYLSQGKWFPDVPPAREAPVAHPVDAAAFECCRPPFGPARSQTRRRTGDRHRGEPSRLHSLSRGGFVFGLDQAAALRGGLVPRS